MLARAGGHPGTAALAAGAVRTAGTAPGPGTAASADTADTSGTSDTSDTENVVNARSCVRKVSAPRAVVTGERRCSHRSHRGRVSPHEVTASYNRPGRTEPHA